MFHFPRTRERLLFSPFQQTPVLLDVVASGFNNKLHFSYFCPSVSSSSFSLPTQPPPSAVRLPIITLSTCSHSVLPQPIVLQQIQYLPSPYLSSQFTSSRPFAGILDIFLQNLPCARSVISHPIYPQNFRPAQQPLFTYHPIDIL